MRLSICVGRVTSSCSKQEGKRKDGGLRGILAIDAFNVLDKVNYSYFIGNLSLPFFGATSANLIAG